MKQDITFPKIIYWIAQILFILSCTLLIYIMSAVMIHFVEEIFSLNTGFLERIKERNNELIFLKIPLTKFGIGFPPKSFEVIFMILFFAFYVFYFYSMKKFFKIFDDNTFSSKSIKSANFFFIINFAPIIYWIIYSIYCLIVGKTTNFFDDEFIILIIHLFVAVLVFLYRDILMKGIKLQEENDLTI